MHVLVALLFLAVLALAVAVSTLLRRSRAQALLLVGLAARLKLLESRALVAAVRLCPRVHAADLPVEFVRAPIPRTPWRDEDESNPVVRRR